MVSFILGRQVLGRAVHWIEEISRFKRTLYVNWQLLLQYNTTPLHPPVPAKMLLTFARFPAFALLCFVRLHNAGDLRFAISCFVTFPRLAKKLDDNDKRCHREPFEYFYENFVFHTITNLQERAKFACEQLRLYDHANTPIAKLWDLT